MTEPIEVPAPRTALPEWIHAPYWTTSQACVVVAAIRGINHESARRWLGRNCVPVDREPGREGENRYAATTVRFRAQSAEVATRTGGSPNE